ncbi:hypothetical protein HPB49_004376 [Dermacentor silvarum]|uniref:Uncharacterized protein n=1 Tax=Dermacentor silvarum TaxID=543639 RepID=A0ACB8D2R4_DERSI|nr:hypothetical protein HPB49_004376 [Dermacentor silvarum]
MLVIDLCSQVDPDITFDDAGDPVDHEAAARLRRRSAAQDSSLSGFASSILRRVRRAWFFGSSDKEPSSVPPTEAPEVTSTTSPAQYTTRRYSRNSDDDGFEASGDGIGDDEDLDDVSSTTHSGAGYPTFDGDRKFVGSPHVPDGSGRPTKTTHDQLPRLFSLLENWLPKLQQPSTRCCTAPNSSTPDPVFLQKSIAVKTALPFAGGTAWTRDEPHASFVQRIWTEDRGVLRLIALEALIARLVN